MSICALYKNRKNMFTIVNGYNCFKKSSIFEFVHWCWIAVILSRSGILMN